MKKLLTVVVTLTFVSAASAQFSDDFESYVDTPAMMAPGAWGDDGGANGVLMLAGGNPTQYMDHPAGPTANHVFTPLTPTDALPVIWKFDFLDDGTSANKRITGGLRTNGGGAGPLQILEMGMYNAFPTGGGYGIRAILGPYGDPNWVQFQNVGVTAGWHEFKAVLTESQVVFTIDLLDDGTIDDTLVFVGPTVAAWNILRLGGPSNLSSAPGGGGFDNVSIEQVPEPASLALLALGGLAVLRRRR